MEDMFLAPSHDGRNILTEQLQSSSPSQTGHGWILCIAHIGDSLWRSTFICPILPLWPRMFSNTAIELLETEMVVVNDCKVLMIFG